MFTDEIEIILKAGHGGKGRVSFMPGSRSGPDGGNGGKGGDLYIVASNNVSNLNAYVGKTLVAAENGYEGGRNKKSGLDGLDLELKFPVGSLFINKETKQEIELLEEGQRVLVCIGGKGGRGNWEFRSSTNTTPRYAQKGLRGGERHFKIIVRMIADFGLIGLPNAGKSSLLNELTNANAGVASYPFTTLEPNLGVMGNLPAARLPEGQGRQGKVIADIPGLIEGASEGKGLGVKFLKHIEKVRLILHCISSESEDVVKDYKTVTKELKEFNPEIAKKDQIILLTKSDLLDKGDLEKKLKQLKKLQEVVLPVSIHDLEAIEKLKTLLG